MDEIKDLATRAGWRAFDGFLGAIVVGTVLDVTAWEVAVVAAVSAGLKPITAFVAGKAGRG